MSRNIQQNQVNIYAGGGEQCLSTAGRTPATASAAAWQEGRTFQVELILCLFCCFKDILVVSFDENMWFLLLYWFKAHQICLPACLILVQSTSPNILTSLLAGAEVLYQRQGAAAAQARKLDFKETIAWQKVRVLKKKLLMKTQFGEY